VGSLSAGGQQHQVSHFLFIFERFGKARILVLYLCLLDTVRVHLQTEIGTVRTVYIMAHPRENYLAFCPGQLSFALRFKSFLLITF
jgi:hypothetical protein